MNHTRPQKVLATDLDGTLIPLDDQPENQRDLETLKDLLTRHDVELVFVTGRHLDSVKNAIEEYTLPATDWIICDVGTSIYQRVDDGKFELLAPYAEHQREILAPMPFADLKGRLDSYPGLRIQEAEKLSEFKLSFYAEQTQLESLVPELQNALKQWQAPWSIVHSVDPFNGDGLIDFLPADVSKAHALAWWSVFTQNPAESIVFAGDSGNDLAALTTGYQSIVVGNAAEQVRSAVSTVYHESGWRDRLCLATRTATSGVLEGCRNFWETKSS